ncbi:MAG TPA: DUF1549 domain-containing protein [Pirellulales bacterium]|jgi:hypothetical protein|nr:DUF1549 domain-containing protein [Pirellulales bacterium]
MRTVAQIFAAWCVVGVVAVADAADPVRIEVMPKVFKLDSPERDVHLIVTGYAANGDAVDLTRDAMFASSNHEVVAVENGVAVPRGNGKAVVVVTVGGQHAEASIEVAHFERREPVSFRYGTLVALTKQGCNQGACHGSPSGKGGFRLSLRAYDPVLDTETLVRETFNRRVNTVEPETSLLLRKPLMELAHGGGRRITKTSASYAILRDWIAQGCQPDFDDAPHCVRLELYPRQRVLHRPAKSQQVLVLAHFSDGSVRDVTDLAQFSSSDEAVATVDEHGLVTSETRGEAAILVRYLEIMDTAYLTFLEQIEGFRWPSPPENNFVDKHVLAKLHLLQIMPADLCTDEEFVRRVYLDVIGMLPTIGETASFLADTSPQKRTKLIDTLLERPEYAEYWAQKWADLLRLRDAKMSAAGVRKFHDWLVRAVATNMPYDRFARALLTADGHTYQNPPANYYRAAADTLDCTETTSQLFLGMRIQCAKCHNHPFERWTQDNYYGIGAFFNRVQRKKVNTDEMIVWVSRSGEVTQPRTGRQMQPWLPLAGDAKIAADADRRQALVDWLVRADNPFFARVEVNRLWGYVMGRGIVDPVDDFRDSNPPSSVELLDALAADFIAHGFDRKHTLRTVLNSRTYQLSSRTGPLNQDDQKYFSHARTRLIPAEPLLDAICEVTGLPEKYAGLPEGSRATQLPSPDMGCDFLKVFGQPARETACQCERSSDSNLSQALQMINGPLIHGKVRSEHNRFRQLMAEGKNDEEIVRQLYLAALCRQPSAAELRAALGHVTGSGDRVRGLEDVCWALLNANEFLFQH